MLQQQLQVFFRIRSQRDIYLTTQSLQRLESFIHILVDILRNQLGLIFHVGKQGFAGDVPTEIPG